MAAICHAVAGVADKEHTGPADPCLHHPCTDSGSVCSHQTPAAEEILHLKWLSREEADREAADTRPLLFTSHMIISHLFFFSFNPSAKCLDCACTNQTLLLPPPNTLTSEELGVTGESLLGVALFMDGFQ